MKTHGAKLSDNQGSVLIITLLICIVLGILMGSYLSMLRTQHFSVARAQAWNNALVVAEAGVEEAMAHINDTNTMKGFAPANKWIYLGGATFGKTNYCGTNYYGVFINTNDPVHPMITSTGYVRGPISSPPLYRVVNVKTKPISGPAYSGAMVVVTTVDLRGSTITTDSFQSTNLTLFPGGLYNAANALDRGDITTISRLANAMDVGNAKIKGTVHTGLGGKVQVGASGSVGDKGWVNGGNKGIQPNHSTNDATQTFPDATLPDTGGTIWKPALATDFVVNGVHYKYLLTSASPYQYVSTLDGSVYVNGAGVKLWVQNGFQFPNDGEIRIPAGKSLAMYVSAPSATLGGNGIINDTGVAKNFQYYGLPSNTALNFSANASFVGQIYAPQAAFTLGGGGNDNYDFVGLSASKSAKMNGNYNFHFDESTAVSLTLFGYTAMSWDELYASR